MALYTLAELDAEIAVYKAALSALAAGSRTRIGEKELWRHDIPSVRDHLQYLNLQRDQLTATGGVPRTAFSRTYAKNGRRGQ